MKLYNIIQLLNVNGYKFIKAMPEYEIWEGREIYLTIPTTYDTLNLRLAKELRSKILGLR